MTAHTPGLIPALNAVSEPMTHPDARRAAQAVLMTPDRRK